MKLVVNTLFILLFGLGISSCSEASHYVIIESENPNEKDYVVECKWSSSKFSLHGGGEVMKRKLLMADAGELVDCGFSAWQLIEGKHKFSVRVYHPMGGGGAGIEHVEEREDEEGVTRDVYVVRPRPMKGYIDDIAKKYAVSKDLDEVEKKRSSMKLSIKLQQYIAGRMRTISRTYPDYFQKASGQPVDVEFLKERYSKRFLEEVEYAAAIPIDEDLPKQFDIKAFNNPEAAIDNLWERMKHDEAAK